MAVVEASSIWMELEGIWIAGYLRSQASNKEYHNG
jgi:hypothetical protein